MMTLAQLEHAQKRMQQKWYELAMAEQRGVAVAILERMYNAYVMTMEEYGRWCAEYQRELQGEPVPVRCKKAAGSHAATNAMGDTKLAS